MNLEHEVRAIMHENPKALTVEQVTQEVADRIGGEVRSILNGLVKKDELNYLHAGGPHQARYMAPTPAPMKRRF